MGKLVSFERGRRAIPSKVEGGARGQIVIFTGVRYERGAAKLPTDGDTPLKPKRRRG